MSDPAATARRLVVGLEGPWPTPAEQAWLERWRPAGVILFARNASGPEQLRALCRHLHAADPNLEIMADHEGGPVAVLAAAVGRPPAAWGLGLLDDPDLTRRVHRDTAARLAACGVDRVLAPVADVLTEPRNPVIGVRAFGDDADKVARHVVAAVEGLREGGCRVCLKHWPGHGGSDVDSHLAAATLSEVPPPAPFLAGLEAGAEAVMIGHLDGGSGVPATLDPEQARRVRGLGAGRPPLLLADDVTMGGLRTALAHRGVAVPEGTGMVDPADLDQGWIAALIDGGCDRLLIRGIPWRAFPAAGESSVPARTGSGDTPGDAEAWTEARRRLAARLPAMETWSASPRAWLNRTRNDRWGPAEGGGSGLLPRGAGPFRAAEGAWTPEVCRLLVTAHRPLDRTVELAAPWLSCLADRGQALAVGHPSLVADLEDMLPRGWEIHGTPEWALEGP